MSNRIFVVGVIATLILAAMVFFFTQRSFSVPIPEQASETDPTGYIDSAAYLCDGGKTIVADYYDKQDAPEPQPGEPPIPTGWAEVSIDGGEILRLPQTISASGVRYATTDESLVFWSKGNDAFIMRDDEVDLDYTNCAAAR